MTGKKRPCPCCASQNPGPGPKGFPQYLACPKCGLLFMERIDKRNRELLGLHYGERDPHQKVADSKTQFFKSALIALDDLVPGPERKILDVGCGFGYFLKSAQSMGWDVHGVEIAHEAVLGARAKLGEQKVFHGALKEAAFPAGFFDAVSLWDVLMASPDPVADLAECRRILKDGGVVGIRDRNLVFQKALHRTYGLFERVCAPLGIKNPAVFHPLSFTPESLRQVLSRAGFSNIRVINSPLTASDPYGYWRFGGLSGMVKKISGLFAGLVFSMSGQQTVVGPSLLAWAEKPGEKT